jgi:ribosomal protein S18 acetylase RimI-like enzyme
MIVYTNSTDSVKARQLVGFFIGWPNAPAPATHLRLLAQSTFVVLAIDDATDNVVGFISAISDGVLSAYIPLLEVLPEYQGQGIGRELVSRMLARLEGLYMVDLLCDERLQAYYQKSGMIPATGMMLRNYARQSGALQGME